MRSIVTTSDGYKTLNVTSLDETYHSRHGAWQEAEYVFIQNGLQQFSNCEIHILELGFGTGLNALATLWALKNSLSNLKVHYHTVERYPVTPEEMTALDYGQLVTDVDWGRHTLDQLHAADWGEAQHITENFTLYKYHASFQQLPDLGLPPVRLVYFDCFGARVQPDLWERPFLDLVVATMDKDSLLTTYASKGSFRRALIELGLDVSKIPGPKGKREMTQAWKK